MEKLFSLLFDDSSRRKKILLLWNVRQPVRGASIFEVVRGFINTVLYAQLYVTMTHEKISFFKNEFGFSLIYETLTKSELKEVMEIHAHQSEIFEDRRAYANNDWKLCTSKQNKLLSQKRRREIVRDFVLLLMGSVKNIKWELIKVTQSLIEDCKKRGDVFIQNLHEKLQGVGDINELIAKD